MPKNNEQPNFDAYIKRRLLKKNFSELTVVDRAAPFCSTGGISKKVSLDEYKQKLLSTYLFLSGASTSDEHMSDLFKINAYEGVMAVADLLNQLEDNQIAKFDLRIGSSFANIEVSHELILAFITLLKHTKTVYLNEILSDELIDCILDAKKRSGKDGAIVFSILTHDQINKYSNFLPESISLYYLLPSVYEIRNSNERGCLSISGNNENGVSAITSTELQDLLAIRKSVFKKLILSKIHNFNLVVYDENIEEIKIEDSLQHPLEAVRKFLEGFRNLKRFSCENSNATTLRVANKHHIDKKGFIATLLGLKLTHISLGNLDDSVVDEIIAIIKTNTSLISLDFPGNQLSSVALKKIIKAIDLYSFSLQTFNYSRLYSKPDSISEDDKQLLEKVLQMNKGFTSGHIDIQHEALMAYGEIKNGSDTDGIDEAKLFEKTHRVKDLALRFQRVCIGRKDEALKDTSSSSGGAVAYVYSQKKELADHMVKAVEDLLGGFKLKPAANRAALGVVIKPTPSAVVVSPAPVKPAAAPVENRIVSSKPVLDEIDSEPPLMPFSGGFGAVFAKPAPRSMSQVIPAAAEVYPEVKPKFP